MAFGLLETVPLFRRLAPALVAAMVFGFVTEASALREERRDGQWGGGRQDGYAYADRGHNYDRRYDRRWSRDRGNRSSVVIYRGPSYYESGYKYGYGSRYGYRYSPRYRNRHYAPRYRGYGRGYGYGNYSRYGSGFGFGFSARGSDAVAIVGLTALTLAVLQHANETQRYAHERAIRRATRAPVGEPIIWNENNGSGRITVTRTGTLPSTGQPCREFTQEVTIDGRQETAYGTACRQPDGAWQLIQ